MSMRAAAIDRFGGPELLTIHEVPIPKIAANEVLIRVDTAGVGIWDVKARKGAWGEKDFPFIPGVDGSGVVTAAGARVRHLNAGDRVYAYSYDNSKGGFYAEYVAVPASMVAKIPEGLDMRKAGAIPVLALTALQGVDDALEIERDETLIIHGASGNVGMFAIQFAKLRGARVIASASGADGVRFARRLGADVAIDGKEESVEETADAVLAFAGGKQLTQCLDALRKGGRVAYPNGVEPAPRKRKGMRLEAYNAIADRRAFERLQRAIEAMDLQVPIAKKFKLRDAAAAHRFVEQGHVLGKVILSV